MLVLKTVTQFPQTTRRASRDKSLDNNYYGSMAAAFKVPPPIQAP